MENLPECGWPASLFPLFSMQCLGEEAEKSTRVEPTLKEQARRREDSYTAVGEPSQVFGSDTLMK